MNMQHNRWGSNLAAQQARYLLVHLLGSPQMVVVLLAVALLVSLGWFADSLFALLDALLQGAIRGDRPPSPWVTLFLALPFLGLAVWLLRKAHTARTDLAFRVTAEPNPPSCSGLILFLSPPFSDEERLANLAIEGALGDPDTLARIRGPWRMPLEALAYHRRTLKEVVVVYSEEKNQEKNDFLDLVRKLWPNPTANICTHSDILGDHQGGVDFYNLEVMVDVTDRLFGHLQRERRLKPRDILIDITGGPKIASAAGAMVALVQWRRFQYVLGTDGTYTVTAFDPIYQTKEAENPPREEKGHTHD
jgi:hypothetical protein